MARGDELGADAVGVIEQLAELDPVVALHAGIGRAAGRVFVDEVVDDPAELGVEIQRVKRNAQAIGDAAGVGGIGGGAAALFVVEAVDDGESCGELHRPLKRARRTATGDWWPWRMKTPITSWPCCDQQVGRDAGIDTAGHG